MLSTEERKKLTEPERLPIGRYQTRGTARACEFAVDIDACPLITLMEAASCGSRVYELMSIRRPGDLLHYLWIHLSGVDQEIVEYIGDRIASRKPWPSKPPAPLESLPFVDFDDCFFWAGDDTHPFAATWLNHRESAYWPEKLDVLFALARKLQDSLRATNDFLLQHEIGLIDAQKHRRDYLANIERQAILKNAVSAQTTLPQDLFQLVEELVTREEVQSVSCPFDDFALWRVLVTEQVRRSGKLGMPPQQAFTLSGPDSGLRHVAAKDWGGEIHIPYEGACGGDLLILPEWRNFFPEAAMGSKGRLSSAAREPCHYVLTTRDYGELDAATRETCGEWFLYRSRLPYSPSNPLGSE